MISSSARKPPNVIIILSDDQGYGDFSCHGNPVLRTPNFDQLHDQSVRFTDFHVAPMCTPTRGQLMTGLDALRNGATAVFGGRTFIRRGMPTMAEVFADGGYRTGLFGKWHLGDNYPFRPEDRGFQETLYFPSASIASAPDYWNNDYFDDHYRHNGEIQQYQGYCTDVFFDQAMQWMRQCQQAGQPFFTYLATGADHMPYFVPDRYREPYRQLNIYLSSFFGMVANYDENIGRLEEFLIRTGLRDDTIIVFMTDNGAVVSVDLFNAGMREGKCSLYDGGHRVPCFVRWPAGGLVSPRALAQPAQCQDWLPTLVELCGLRADIPSDGVSLAGVLRDPQARLAKRMLVVQYGDEPVKYNATVIWDQWRLVYHKQLYHIGEDPAQTRNLAEAHPDVMQAMRDHYERWWEGLGPGVSALERIGVGSEQENPACLAHLDWRGPFLNYQTQIRSLEHVHQGSQLFNGPWNLNVEQAGEYEIALRRWPAEADAPIAGGLPEFIPTDRAFYHLPRPGPEAISQLQWAWIGAASQAGKAIPVAAARCQIGEFDQTIPVSPQDTAAVFKMTLPAGPATLGTWFHDAQSREICGAFYVSITRLTG